MKPPFIITLLLIFSAGLMSACEKPITTNPGECVSISTRTTLTQPGQYCLTQNIIVEDEDQPGLVIAADNVTLDMQGRSIVSTPLRTLGTGIRTDEHQNIQIQNGRIEGFLYGIGLHACDNCRVINMHMERNLLSGIRIYGDGAYIADSFIGDMFGLDGVYASSYTFGIEASGTSARIENNEIKNIYPFREGEGLGISLSRDSTNAVIRGNEIRWDNNQTLGRLIGIWIALGDNDPEIVSNTIDNADYGFGGRMSSSVFDNHLNVHCNTWIDFSNAELEEANIVTIDKRLCNDSLERLRTQLEEDPENGMLHFRLALAQATQGYDPEAFINYQKACALDFLESCRQLERFETVRGVDDVSAPTGCTPIFKSTTITQSGRYCLTQSILIEGENQPGIVIVADNVTFDMQGLSITATLPDTLGVGIRADSQQNITIKNGNISGFLSGVSLNEIENATLENLNLSSNQWRGARLLGDDIRVDGLIIRDLAGHRPYANSPPRALDVEADTCTLKNITYGHIVPIHWSDNTGLLAPNCDKSVIIDEGLPANYCLPIIRPDTLSQPGRYCLQNDLLIESENQSGIVITSDDVMIDLKGHTIRSDWPDTLGNGIYSYGFDNISILNGQIEGFMRATRLEECEGCDVNAVNMVTAMPQ